MRAVLLVTALLLAPIARADDACKMSLGRGWPSATENYGSAVERLFAVGSQPAWSYTLLPKTGEESGLMLIPTAEGRDWTLRRAIAHERVHYWGPTKLELRTNQEPELHEVAIPAAVAVRFAQTWDRALSMAAPEGSVAPFSEKDTWLFVVGDRRVSGLEPTCELGELMRDQIDLLTEASDEGDEKREKRWRQLGKSLDRMRDLLDAMSKSAAQ